MTIDVGDDKVVEPDWDRLVSWFAGLCQRDSASDCLPAALWLLCTSAPPECPGSGPSPSEVEAVRFLVSQLEEGARCLELGRPLPRPIEPRGPLTWKMFAENLKAALRVAPHLFRVYVWFTIDFLGYVRFRVDLAEPAESEIRALLDYQDLYHPDLLPAVRSMMSSLPAAREVLSRWQPSELSPQEKIVRKMMDFAFDALATMVDNRHDLEALAEAALGEKVSRWKSRFLRAANEAPEDLTIADLPIAALHQVDQIIDDPALSIAGKSEAILEVLTLGVEGKVVSH